MDSVFVCAGKDEPKVKHVVLREKKGACFAFQVDLLCSFSPLWTVAALARRLRDARATASMDGASASLELVAGEIEPDPDGLPPGYPLNARNGPLSSPLWLQLRCKVIVAILPGRRE